MRSEKNPEFYAVVIRCPLKDGAKLKTLAEAHHKNVSTFMGQVVRRMVGRRKKLNAEEQAWFDEHRAMNVAMLERAEAKTASRPSKRRHVGRPRKPGPKKGSKHRKND